MNPQSSTQRRNWGITLLEVMVLLVVIACLGVFVCLPYLTRGHSHGSHARIHCVNNLKMIGLSHRQWAVDHGDRYPMAVRTKQGGTLDHAAFDQAWPHLTALSNELNTPKILWCGSDDERVEAEVFGETITDRNISYFVGLAADETKPTVILSGDRNLTANGLLLKPGLYTLRTNDALGWTKAMHRQAGNIGLSDGSVQQFSAAGLQQYLRDNPQANRFAIP